MMKLRPELPWYNERILVRLNIPAIRIDESEPELEGEIEDPETGLPWADDKPLSQLRTNIFVFGWRGREVECIPCMDPVTQEFLYLITRKQYAQFLQ